MQYQYIIDTTISHEEIREVLKSTLTLRRGIFSQVNGELKLRSQVVTVQNSEEENEINSGMSWHV